MVYHVAYRLPWPEKRLIDRCRWDHTLLDHGNGSGFWKNMKKWHHFCAHAQWWSPLGQPRNATTNTLASMLLYSIWITRNKTVHREGLCDREGTVAIRIQLYFYSYLKSCIKLDYQVAKIENKLTDFRKFWAGLCQISDSNSLHFLF